MPQGILQWDCSLIHMLLMTFDPQYFRVASLKQADSTAKHSTSRKVVLLNPLLALSPLATVQ